jgi:dihydroxy-acid dehydratase
MKKKITNYSSIITQNINFPAAQAMLYGSGFNKEDFKKPQIGIVSNWYEGNPCNMILNFLSKKIKKSIKKKKMIGLLFNTIGISDGISMGTPGMKYSLPSREIIADSIESVANAHYYDGIIAIPGCDKNLPGSLIGIIRVNKPSIIVYGGSISPGYLNKKKLDIVSAFEALGKLKTNNISKKKYKNIIKKSCPGPGACGGMYTANTMACALEAMGMTLPYSSSTPTNKIEKKQECEKIGKYIKNLLIKNITPNEIISKESLKNAITLTIALGGSTNLVLHLLAIANSSGIKISLKDFQKISEQTPLIGNLKPSGKFLMEDIYFIGGIPIIMKYLLKEGLLEGNCITVTGFSLKKNLKKIRNISFKNQKIIFPLNNPIKKNGNIRILYGNIAPEGAVAKISGKEGTKFSGKAKTFNSEEEANNAIINNKIKNGTVIVIRYVGPKGGPGMPEMLKPTSLIMGKGLGKNVALITDGRFSGGSHGFVVGHITPEAQEGGIISIIKDGDNIIIDAIKNKIILNLSKKKIEKRKLNNKINFSKKRSGYLYKYSKLVSSASKGCITDLL